MKVLQVSHNYHVVGGSDAVFFATCDLLKNAGHKVVPFCIDSAQNKPTGWDRYFPNGANTKAAPIRDGVRYFYNLEAKRKLENLLDDVGGVDVAHLHIYHGKQTPAILHALRKRGIPIMQTLHEYKLACPVYTMQRGHSPCSLCVEGSNWNCLRHRCKDGSFSRSLIMAAEHVSSRLLGDVRFIDRFLCVSNFQKQVMERAGIPPEKLFTLHNFANTAGNPRCGHGGYFLYFGRIEKLKGLPTLLSAFKRNGHHLKIAGDGHWRAELETAIKGLPNIEYLGFQNRQEVQELLANAQAVIVPSEWNENCPMSVLEAKSLGCPVIGTNIGGIPELIQDGIDGALFEPGDVDGLISAVECIQSQAFVELSNRAWQDSMNRFSSQAHLKMLLAHYEKIIRRSDARAGADWPALGIHP